MTNKQANELFRKKYPNGRITTKKTTQGNRFGVVFDETVKNHQLYLYACGTYQELFNKLGITVTYSHDIEAWKASIAKYQKDIDDGKTFEKTGNRFYRSEAKIRKQIAELQGWIEGAENIF